MARRDPETNPAAFLGAELRRARMAAGLSSQEALAARVGFDRTVIAKAETGERPPTIEVLTAWCEACQLSGAFDIASTDGTPDTLRTEGVEDQTTENRTLVRKAAIIFDLVRRDALPRVPSRDLILEAAEQWKSR
jgi:transcriptional regulator with XRE-family HTH domain